VPKGTIPHRFGCVTVSTAVTFKRLIIENFGNIHWRRHLSGFIVRITAYTTNVLCKHFVELHGSCGRLDMLVQGHFAMHNDHIHISI